MGYLDKLLEQEGARASTLPMLDVFGALDRIVPGLVGYVGLRIARADTAAGDDALTVTFFPIGANRDETAKALRARMEEIIGDSVVFGAEYPAGRIDGWAITFTVERGE